MNLKSISKCVLFLQRKLKNQKSLIVRIYPEGVVNVCHSGKQVGAQTGLSLSWEEDESGFGY